MKLTKTALEAVKDSTRCKTRLALALDCSVFTIDRYIGTNSDNLTKAAALEVIQEETGLSDEQILDRVECGC